jgi:hypothetical protein
LAKPLSAANVLWPVKYKLSVPHTLGLIEIIGTKKKMRAFWRVQTTSNDTPSKCDDFFQSFLCLNTSPQTADVDPTGIEPVSIPVEPLSLDFQLPLSPSQSEPALPYPTQLSPPQPISHYLSTENPTHPTPQISPLPPRRSSQFRRQNVRLDDYILSIDEEDFDVCLVETTPDLVGENLTFDQACTIPEWVTAMDDEIKSIEKNKTFDMVPLPVGKSAITAKWVYKKKPGINGGPPRYKAHLVARRFEQRYGIDFEEMFAPVVKWSTIRALIARTAHQGHTIHHMDVKTTFLYGLLRMKSTWINLRVTQNKETNS